MSLIQFSRRVRFVVLAHDNAISSIYNAVVVFPCPSSLKAAAMFRNKAAMMLSVKKRAVGCCFAIETKIGCTLIVLSIRTTIIIICMWRALKE